ncbi:MAG: hypothetical protein HKN32_03430 [Flavobacteriales bacterium]|nr:hypothetical protein [Flavobacteriales bacterium]
MKKLLSLCLLLLLVGTTSAQRDREAEVPVMPEKVDKLKSVLNETKLKSVIKEKELVLSNFRVTFYQTAFHKFKSNTAVGKVGGRAGFALDGVSDQTMQAITDECREYFVSELESRGYTIQGSDVITSTKKYTKLADKAKSNGTQEEMFNLDMTKKVQAKTFVSGADNILPGLVGTPAYMGVIKEAKTGLVSAEFKINFISLGNETSRSFDTVTYGITFHESVHGKGEMSIYSSKLGLGWLSMKKVYRHADESILQATTDTQDGFYVVQADETKYRHAAVEHIKAQIDLFMKQIDETSGN